MHLIDTHCHIQNMIKADFDKPLLPEQIDTAKLILDESRNQQVTTIINVGTSVVESKNAIALAQAFSNCWASIGIHPNDLTDNWQEEFRVLKKLAQDKEKNKIVAIGECGIDKHYPEYKMQRQQDAFVAQIELALEHDLALIVHTREAPEETLRCLDDYSKESLRGTIHCFSENLSFAKHAIQMGFVLGLGGTITYPKNEGLRTIAKTISLEQIILETDAPFLPPQPMRGKQNHPKNIRYIAEFLADLLGISLETLSQQTTQNATRVFRFSQIAEYRN